ncbi:glutamate--tRNA ligase [Paenibacillus oceani]|uniref:Glutamate--tRNA ligase n=1 Tax=Paenibacillus oceani TaxID=2772510 RepID=A0A927CCB9_9BACL|nr:glutamate--tRNA ligase family protein [Paenibacillus oceani]MBD2865035.1 glutamate--tRNA ligase [Paenibacillus oceani]
MTTLNELADLLFPNVARSPEDVLALYPPRNLPQGAKVTRFAPSPTGFLTIGGLYATMISERLARSSGGVFYLRIEDTDKKREVEGSMADMIESLAAFGIAIDEGPAASGEETGAYGPYRQSMRVPLYHVWVKQLVRQGLAYPCFCTEEELQAIRDKQQERKVTPGYYGEWAVHRFLTPEQAKEELAAGKPYVIRLKSLGSPVSRIGYTDLVKGPIEMPENDHDIVLLKSDGIPTYHFAHAIDDRLMGTTHVFRGDEWLSSVPIHLQLFEVLGFQRPEYGHIAPIMKMDGTSKRKFSKRKDRDATANYYRSQGYPSLSINEYFMTLINSDYEQWRMDHPAEPYTRFAIDTNKMNASGALFDMDKLNDISKDVISKLSAESVFTETSWWAKAYDPELCGWLRENKDYTLNIFRIGRTPEKPRKDMAKWGDVRSSVAFFHDGWFAEETAAGYPLPTAVDALTARGIAGEFLDRYDPQDDRDTWFGKVKEIAEAFGFAKDTKAYKKHPETYKGSVGDVAAVLRSALSGRLNAPDLYDVMNVMGEERVRARLNRFVLS